MNMNRELMPDMIISSDSKTDNFKPTIHILRMSMKGSGKISKIVYYGVVYSFI